MTALKPYRAYRESGVEWLGKVPEHWEVAPLKRAGRFCSGSGFPVAAQGNCQGEVLFAKVSDMNRPGNSREIATAANSVTKIVARDLGAQVFPPGTIIFPKVGGALLTNKRRIVVRETCIDNNLMGCVATNADTDFVFRVLQWLDLGRMAKPGPVPAIGEGEVREIRTPLPPLPEQTAIARYLDQVTARIRRYIGAKEKLLTLLEEERQATIHEAVTGRIDVRTGQPYPAYKDSGIKWLRAIPDHWMRCRLGNVVSEVTTGSRGWSRYAADDGPLFVRVGNLSRGSLQLRLEHAVRLDLPVTSEAARTRIAEGDLLLSVTAHIGSVGIAPEGLGEAYVSQHVARCRPFPAVNSKWLGYVLLSSLGQTYGQTRLYGGTKDGLSLDDVRNYPILMPSRDEQRELVGWIERRLSLLGELRDATHRQIALLREYRTRLVTDVVTGKLDVRQAAVVLAEVASVAGGSRSDTIHTKSHLHATEHNIAEEADA